jgi:hypothetical protein
LGFRRSDTILPIYDTSYTTSIRIATGDSEILATYPVMEQLRPRIRRPLTRSAIAVPHRYHAAPVAALGVGNSVVAEAHTFSA